MAGLVSMLSVETSATRTMSRKAPRLSSTGGGTERMDVLVVQSTVMFPDMYVRIGKQHLFVMMNHENIMIHYVVYACNVSASRDHASGSWTVTTMNDASRSDCSDSQMMHHFDWIW